MNEINEINETNETTETTETKHHARITALQARLAETPPPDVWRPEPGETIIGEFMSIKEVDYPTNGMCWKITIRCQDRKTWVVLANYPLMKCIWDNHVAVGHYVALTFVGQVKSDYGGHYDYYSLLTEGQNPV